MKVCTELPQPIVFLAWGKYAQDLIHRYISEYESPAKIMNERKKVCLPATHPSPFSANRASSTAPAFIGCRCFSQANKLLEQMGGEPVDWSLP